MRRPGFILTILISLSFVIHFSYTGTNSQENLAGDTRLVVVISIDQMRYDFLERFEPYFKHGFRRLLDEGAVYTNAHHRHAITHTAPGHASLSTGTRMIFEGKELIICPLFSSTLVIGFSLATQSIQVLISTVSSLVSWKAITSRVP